MFANLISFEGRIRRAEFAITLIVCYFVRSFLFIIFDELIILGNLLSTITDVFLVLIFFSQSVKRLHDMDQTGWLAILPVYNPILLLFVDGERIYTHDEFCIFVNRLGVVYQEDQDEQGFPSFNIYPCKKKNSLAILQQGSFWDDDTLSRFQRRDSDKLLFSLARKGFPINKKQFKVISKFDLLKEVYPNAFRVLTAEESYYYWRIQS